MTDQNRMIATGKQNDYKRVWTATLKSFGLSVLTIILLGPFVVSQAIDVFYRGNTTMSQPSLVSGLFYLLHQIVSPIFILTSYKECRYHVAVGCSLCLKNKRENIKRNYQQHYATFIISPAGVSSETDISQEQ